MAEELIQAIESGKLTAVRQALRSKPSKAVLARAAVMAGGRVLLPVLQLLHKHGADFNGVWRGYRPLHNLIQERPHGETKPTPERLACLEWLLENGADPELPGAWPPSRSVVVAAFMGEPAFVKVLRASGAKVDGFAAAALGDRKLVEKTLASDAAFPNSRDIGGLTALQCACGGRMARGEYAAIARLLLDAGADPLLRTKSWSHELDASYYAGGAKDPALLETLLERGADPQEALGHIVWGKHFELAEMTLRHGAKPDRAMHEGKPLLNNLIRWGQMTQTFWLLDHGASPNVSDTEGWTAVHQAASRGNPRMVTAVLEAGGDRARRDKLGHTPGDVAQITKRTKLIPILRAARPVSGGKLRKQLGPFDATMIVMGGIVGSGIFINPSVVAKSVHTPFLILGVWVAGGMLAMLGAFIWAELATRLPGAGGQYLYLREAYHPSVAFVYGWVLLLVTNTGGMAAVAVTFARYYREITGFQAPDGIIAATVLLGLTAINCFGVRAGSSVQSLLMVLKASAIVALVVVGFIWGGGHITPTPLLDQPMSFSLIAAIGAAMTPVAFAYGGWQTASFVAGEMRNPRRDLARGLFFGVFGVVLLYLSVNVVCLKVLGPEGLAATKTPASAVMRAAFGERGAQWIAMGIAISTLGFLSQGILTAPRVYYAMARDGLFFETVGRLSAKTGAPVVAIGLQGLAATLVALIGNYEKILNYEVAVDFISFALTAASLFVFRRRDRTLTEAGIYRSPLHPFTTVLFVAACAAIVIATMIHDPSNAFKGQLILLTGIPVYLYWSRRRKKAAVPTSKP